MLSAACLPAPIAEITVAAPVLDGSAKIPLRWGGLLVALGTLATLITGGILLARWLLDTKQR